MADPNASPKKVSFEHNHPSSSDDDDRNQLEVVFEELNPYRRKSSLVTIDNSPPRLQRQPSPHSKTECLVHQFLACQRRQRPPHAASGRREQHHHDAGTAIYEADDISSEAGLDRSLDLKDANRDQNGDGRGENSQSDKEQPDGRLERTASKKELKLPVSASPEIPRSVPGDTPQSDEEDYQDGRVDRKDHADSGNASASTSTSSTCGQADEKQWRAEMLHLGQTPSQLDRRCSTGGPDAPPNSRLLTKKELSEMVWGVRELSRRLGSMRLRFHVRNVFVLTKIYDAELITHTRELCRWLLDRERDVRYTVYVDRELKGDRRFDAAGLVEEVRSDFVENGEASEEASWDVMKRLRFWDEEMCRTRPHTFDFVVTLGGDGTVLYASWLFQRIVPPVLSFALGSLGFLTKFDFGHFRETLTSAFNKGVTVSLRLRFEATVMRSRKTGSRLKADGQHAEDDMHGQCKGYGPPRDLVEELIGEEKDDEHTHRPDATFEVLNEVVVDRGPNPTMSNIEIFGDDEHFTSVSADGVCVSTPTGSTAYNLAAGGSLCHPENPVMLVTAICAHTLSFRPVILPDTIVLRLGVPYDARTSSWASFDGRERVELRPGDYVTVSASRYPFACVQPHGRRSEDWINSISAKLGWNTRQRQKAFTK
ncbi:hypothetical protein VTK26DRAFT_5814 [Humicola hyalothermophila]